MRHTVEHDCADCHLSRIRLAARFGGNDLGKQIDVIASVLPVARRSRGDTERGKRARSCNAVYGKSVIPLKSFDGALRQRSVNTVHVACEIAEGFQLLLNTAYLVAPRPHFGKRGNAFFRAVIHRAAAKPRYK